MQILSTAHRVLDGSTDPILYKKTHQNHPSSIWVRQSIENYLWCYKQTKALCKEYTFRYGKVHKGEREGLLKRLSVPPKNLSHCKLTKSSFVQVVDDSCRGNNTVKAYRDYFNQFKFHMADWKKRKEPEWFKMNMNI